MIGGLDFSSGEWAGLAGAITALAVLMYQSPARAWRLLAKSHERRIESLEKAQERLEEAIKDRDASIRDRDGVIRRLRSYIAALQNLLHEHGVPVPAPLDDGAPDIAPERRSPVVSARLVAEDETPKP